jgi:hypothetical protein
MSAAELRAALEPRSESVRAFAADKRTRPAIAAAPLVLHFEIPYRQWDGPKLPWAEDFGKGRGQVYSRDGSEPVRSCGEIEVAKRLRRVRQHAVWISCYRPGQIPAIWRPWARAPEEGPDWLRSLDQGVRQFIRVPKGGIPDVVAWNDDDPLASALLVECKGPTESFKEGQQDWVSAALQHGLHAEQIAVAIRSFVS